MTASSRSRVYVAHHRPGVALTSDALVPLHVGKVLSDLNLGMVGDDTGPNISSKNPVYCELTATYWAWKNDTESDYIGIAHYRRFLAPSGIFSRSDRLHGHTITGSDPRSADALGLTQNSLRDYMKNAPLGILSAPLDVSLLGYANLCDHYLSTSGHLEEDLVTAKKVLGQFSEQEANWFDEVMSGVEMFPGNMFILPRNIFHNYCEWLFPRLEEIERLTDISGRTNEEKRFIGFLAERLTSVWARRVEAQHHSQFKLAERVFIHPLDISKPSKILTTGKESDSPSAEDKVHIALASDWTVLWWILVVMKSVIDQQPKLPLHFHVFAPPKSHRRLKRLINKLGPLRHVEVSFYSISKLPRALNRRDHISSVSWIRVFLHGLLPNAKKAIWLDTDVLVRRDISELWNLDMHGAPLMAAHDYIAKVHTRNGFRVWDGQTFKDFCVTILGIKDPEAEYRQAGVLVLDLDQLRRTGVGVKLESSSFHLAPKTQYLDQDVINSVFEGQFAELPLEWNSLPLPESYLPHLSADELELNRSNGMSPAIAHFAGSKKPWHKRRPQKRSALESEFWAMGQMVYGAGPMFLISITSSALRNGQRIMGAIRSRSIRVWRRTKQNRGRLSPVVKPIKRFRKG